MLTSSGSIEEEYETIGLVVGFASSRQTWRGTVDVPKAYKASLQSLVESARARGADGVIHVSFQNRVAIGPGCAGSKQVFEVFAWGTAVKLRRINVFPD